MWCGMGTVSTRCPSERGKASEPRLGGSLALALTLAQSDLENPVQSDGERAISLPQDGSTGTSAPCTVETCWEVGTCLQRLLNFGTAAEQRELWLTGAV